MSEAATRRGQRSRVRSPSLEEHDPIGVRPFRIIIDAPAVGGFGELLVVDEHERLTACKATSITPGKRESWFCGEDRGRQEG